MLQLFNNCFVSDCMHTHDFCVQSNLLDVWGPCSSMLPRPKTCTSLQCCGLDVRLIKDFKELCLILGSTKDVSASIVANITSLHLLSMAWRWFASLQPVGHALRHGKRHRDPTKPISWYPIISCQLGLIPSYIILPWTSPPIGAATTSI